jgi:hypothetical protein
MQLRSGIGLGDARITTLEFKDPSEPTDPLEGAGALHAISTPHID